MDRPLVNEAPGTVVIQDGRYRSFGGEMILTWTPESDEANAVVLEPTPSDDPNDPLVCA